MYNQPSAIPALEQDALHQEEKQQGWVQTSFKSVVNCLDLNDVQVPGQG